MGWGGRWEGVSKGRRHMYTYGWFMLRFGRKQQNSVKQLSFNKKKIKKKNPKQWHACSVVSDSSTPWTVVLQAPLSLEFSRQEYRSGLPFPTAGNLCDPGMEPMSLASPALVPGLCTTVPCGKHHPSPPQRREQMNSYETSVKYRCRKQTFGYRGGGGINWEIWINLYTLLYIINNKNLLYSTGNSTEHSNGLYGKRI